jgi:hypothetical protein
MLTRYSWSAVVRGAVSVGLEGKSSAVVHRKSRRHYGTACSRLFDSRIHSEEDWYMHPQLGLPYATNQMAWVLVKGQDLHASEPTHATTDLLPHFWPGQSRVLQFDLMACDDDQSPSHSGHKVNRHIITLSITNGAPGHLLCRECHCRPERNPKTILPH